ncbi:thiamine pyrophosphate-binding protein, partial [Candidatus Thorarchaeota archaeon]
CTMAGKGAFPEDHPLFGFYPGTKGSPIGNRLTSNADVILALGCRFADETTSSYKQGESFDRKKTDFIQVDIEPYELGKNYRVTLPILADVRTALRQMFDLIPDSQKQDYKGSKIVEQLKQEKDEWSKQLAKQRGHTPMTISEMLAVVRDTIPRDAFVVTSAGHTQAVLFQEFPILEPGTNITSGGFSTMGFGVPASMGVSLAHPDRVVVSVEGDGSFLMTAQELATAVQYDIPIKIVLADNQGWISIRDLQIDAYGADRGYATEFAHKKDGNPSSPDFVALAKAFGCWARSCHTVDELKENMGAALNVDGPALVVVNVNREHPFSESPVYGWWDVPKPTYLD